MYAVLKTGGKQYRVAVGDKIKVEILSAGLGARVALNEVLLISEGAALKVGAPYVEGAAVHATVLSQGRHKKVNIFKMRRRKHYQKHQGHRQGYTELLIDSIEA